METDQDEGELTLQGLLEQGVLDHLEALEKTRSAWRGASDFRLAAFPSAPLVPILPFFRIHTEAFVRSALVLCGVWPLFCDCGR